MVSETEIEAGSARYAAWQNLPEMFFDQAGRLGDAPFLWAKHDGAWRSRSWRELAAEARAVAAGLIGLGLRPGDRVMLVAENRPEWLVADVAIMAAGGITVPTYTTNTPDDHAHILTDSGARLAIVSTPALLKRLLAAAPRAPHLEAIVAIEPPPAPPADGPRVVAWASLAAAEPGAGLPVAARADTACLIYTSGTGGVPKGVMLSHGAILCNCRSAYHLLVEAFGLEDEVFLSFLPLSHSYEHTAGQFFPVSIGAQIYYAESVADLARNMTETRPTIMTAVPRLYETMHGRILQGMSRTEGLKKKLFLDAVALGKRRYAGSLGLVDRAYDALLDRLVRAKVAERFGGRMKALVSGGAPLNEDIGLFFTALGVTLLQGYGQTESAPIVSCNPPGRIKIHTVGPPLHGVEVRIAEDGEILVRGELVMRGYWGKPDATAEVVRDGWLHTGDIGVIDADGYIQITDRKKDLIVNSGGDNISPQRVEGFLALEPEIAQAMVQGDRKPFLVALIVPDAQEAAAWARAAGKPHDLATLADDPEFRRHVGAAVDRVNARLSLIERVRHFVIAAEPFSVENGMLTPSMKIRRHAIRAHYGPALEALYGAKAA